MIFENCLSSKWILVVQSNHNNSKIVLSTLVLLCPLNGLHLQLESYFHSCTFALQIPLLRKSECIDPNLI